MERSKEERSRNRRKITKHAKESGRSFLSRVSLFFVCFVFLLLSANGQTKSKPTDARAAVQAFFSLLKTQQYQALYDFLPGQLQQQITREQLTFSLKRLDAFITIQKMEISRVQQKGDFAVVDTTIYGLLKKPINMNGDEVKEGRVSAQQYLFKENDRWKVVTADSRTRDFFIKRNPDFNKQFQLKQPRFEFKRDGKWIGRQR